MRKGTEDGSAFYAVTFFFDRHPFDFLDILREHRKARTPAFIAKLDASQAAAAAAEDEDPVEAAAGACHVPHTVSRKRDLHLTAVVRVAPPTLPSQLPLALASPRPRPQGASLAQWHS